MCSILPSAGQSQDSPPAGFFHPGPATKNQPSQHRSPSRLPYTGANAIMVQRQKRVRISESSTGVAYDPDRPPTAVHSSKKERKEQIFSTFWRHYWANVGFSDQQHYDKIGMAVMLKWFPSRNCLKATLKNKRIRDYLNIFFPDKLVLFEKPFLCTKLNFRNNSILPTNGYVRLLNFGATYNDLRNLSSLEQWNKSYSSDHNYSGSCYKSRHRAYETFPLRPKQFQRIIKATLLADISPPILGFANAHAPACLSTQSEACCLLVSVFPLALARRPDDEASLLSM